jgi:hypothetical protein
MKLSISWCSALCISFLVAIGCRSTRSGGDADHSAPVATQRQPLTIDGSDKDWVKPLPYFDKSEQLSYSITNDGQYVSILMSTKSPQEQQKIIQGGMTVWINTRADKSISEAKGIGYPLDKRSSREQSIMAQARPDKYTPKTPTLEDRREYELYDFNANKDSTIESYTYADENPAGVLMRMDFNAAGELIYEAAIPLAALFHDPRSYVGKSIAVGFIIEGLPPGTNVPRGQGGGPEIGVGGGLGFGSFGSGGGIGLSIGTGSLIGGGRGGNKQMFRQGQVWQVVELARH